MTDGFRVEVDWNKDGTYTDETAYVRPRQSALSAEYGRDQATALAPTVSGQASIVLDNSTRRFSPRNTASPLYGTLKPARPVRITRTFTGLPADIYTDTYTDLYGTTSGGTGTYTLFAGHTDDQPINPDLDSRTVTVSLVDWLADFRSQTITTALHSGIRTGQAIGHILDACNWPADKRDLDTGATVIPWWWENDTNALEAMERVVRSEGPPALLTVGTDGEIVFRDRHHRLLRAASKTSQQTWGDTALPLNKPFSYDEAWDHVINHGTVSVDQRAPGQLEVVWSSDTTITLAGTKLVTVSSTDPFYDAQTPEVDTDYTLTSGSVTVSLFRTSGGSTTIQLDGSGVVAGLQLRARPLPVTHTEQISASDELSRADYGTRSYPSDLPWCGLGDAEAVLRTAVTLRAQPLPIVRARILVGNITAKAAVLARDLGDRVTIIEAETVTNGPFFIEAIAHEMTGPFDHAITFGLEAAPVQRSPVVRLNVSGPLGSGYLSNPAIDPQHLLILGDNASGHRLGEGMTAA